MSLSRIGKKLIVIPAGVTVDVAGSTATVKGPKGTLQVPFAPEFVAIRVEGSEAFVDVISDAREAKAMHGLYRSLLANAITGVSTGFTKALEVRGVGYKFAIAGDKLTLQLGFSHDVVVQMPAGVTVAQNPENKMSFIISGYDKQLVGQVAADIRSFRSPEPYKGKGIRYIDEFVKIRPGKTTGK